LIINFHFNDALEQGKRQKVSSSVRGEMRNHPKRKKINFRTEKNIVSFSMALQTKSYLTKNKNSRRVQFGFT